MTTSQLQWQDDDREETYKWTIPKCNSCNYDYGGTTELQTGLTSPKFTSKDKRITMKMMLYPNGISQQDKNFGSIYLECESSSTLDITVKYKLSLLNKKLTETTVEYWIGILHGRRQLNTVFPKFIEKNVLDSIRNGRPYAGQRDYFCTVVCKWIIIESFIIDAHKFLPSWGAMRKNFQSSLESKKFSDVTLVAGGREFPAHKVILATHSPVFSAMFESEMQEQTLNRVNIIDINDDVLEELLKFIYYADNSEKLDNMAQQLLIAADKYDIKQLKDVCEKSLVKSLTVNNSVEILILANECNSTYLKEEALDFIAENAGEIVLKNIYHPLDEQLLKEVLHKMASKQTNSKTLPASEN